MHTGLANTWSSNLLQIPIVVATTIITGALKKRCCDRTDRQIRTWRYDMLRQTAATLYGFATIVGIAIAFDGDDCVNFFTVYCCDVVVGMLIESWVIQMVRAGGYKLGFYGNPPAKRKLQEQTVMACLVSIMSRCTSGILAVAAFPMTNKQFDSHITTNHGWAYMVVVAPSLYILLRMLVLDNIYVAPQTYRRVMHIPLTASAQSAFAVGNESSDDDIADKRENSTGADNPICSARTQQTTPEPGATAKT